MLYKSGSGFTGSVSVLCRQPKNMIIHNRTFDGMYKGRTDNRWQKLVTSFDSANQEFIAAKISDVVQLSACNEFVNIKLRNQKEVTCLPTQKFLTREGYKAAEDLKEGDAIGVMRSKLAWYAVIDEITRINEAFPAFAVQLNPDNPLESIIVNGIIAKVEQPEPTIEI